MSTLDEITKGKQQVTEALARVDAQREKLIGQLGELEATERVLARYSKGTRPTKMASATTLSGGFMGMAGAPFPYYIGYLQPASAFGLEYAVNSIAMPMIGGTTMWFGPLVGAILLGSLQQIATVTISSAVNLLIVGLLLVAFVIIAPNGLIGLVQERLRARRQP